MPALANRWCCDVCNSTSHTPAHPAPRLLAPTPSLPHSSNLSPSNLHLFNVQPSNLQPANVQPSNPSTTLRAGSQPKTLKPWALLRHLRPVKVSSLAGCLRQWRRTSGPGWSCASIARLPCGLTTP
ncbi:MAG: hypothetical protein U0401_20200 [Anaerolineae bacterium]